VGAALAMAEDTSGVGSAGGADKATVAASEALGPRAYGGAGGQYKRLPHGEIDAPLRKGEQAPVESERWRGVPTSWACRGRIRQDMERM